MKIDFSKIPLKINEEFIKSKVDEKTIFYNYFGNFELGKIYSSPFRRDKKPSFGFYINQKGRLTAHDITNGEKWDAFTFVGKKYGLNYNDSLRKVAQDFGLISGNKIFNKEEIFHIDEIKKETIIQIIPDKWKKEYIKYWNQFGLEFEDLPLTYLFPVKKLWVNKIEIPIKEIKFALIAKENEKLYIKIYTPYAENLTYKFVSNIPINVPFGLDLLPYKSNTLYVTKSFKDWLVLKKIHSDVISLQNESEEAFCKELYEELSKKYDKIIICFDADPPGIRAANKLKEKFNILIHTIPKDIYNMFGIKDFAEYSECYGIKELKILFKNI